MTKAISHDVFDAHVAQAAGNPNLADAFLLPDSFEQPFHLEVNIPQREIFDRTGRSNQPKQTPVGIMSSQQIEDRPRADIRGENNIVTRICPHQSLANLTGIFSVALRV